MPFHLFGKRLGGGKSSAYNSNNNNDDNNNNNNNNNNRSSIESGVANPMTTTAMKKRKSSERHSVRLCSPDLPPLFSSSPISTPSEVAPRTTPATTTTLMDDDRNTNMGMHTTTTTTTSTNDNNNNNRVQEHPSPGASASSDARRRSNNSSSSTHTPVTAMNRTTTTTTSTSTTAQDRLSHRLSLRSPSLSSQHQPNAHTTSNTDNRIDHHHPTTSQHENSHRRRRTSSVAGTSNHHHTAADGTTGMMDIPTSPTNTNPTTTILMMMDAPLSTAERNPFKPPETTTLRRTSPQTASLPITTTTTRATYYAGTIDGGAPGGGVAFQFPPPFSNLIASSPSSPTSSAPQHRRRPSAAAVREAVAVEKDDDEGPEDDLPAPLQRGAATTIYEPSSSSASLTSSSHSRYYTRRSRGAGPRGSLSSPRLRASFSGSELAALPTSPPPGNHHFTAVHPSCSSPLPGGRLSSAQPQQSHQHRIIWHSGTSDNHGDESTDRRTDLCLSQRQNTEPSSPLFHFTSNTDDDDDDNNYQQPLHHRHPHSTPLSRPQVAPPPEGMDAGAVLSATGGSTSWSATAAASAMMRLLSALPVETTASLREHCAAIALDRSERALCRHLLDVADAQRARQRELDRRLWYLSRHGPRLPVPASGRHGGGDVGDPARDSAAHNHHHNHDNHNHPIEQQQQQQQQQMATTTDRMEPPRSQCVPQEPCESTAVQVFLDQQKAETNENDRNNSALPTTDSTTTTSPLTLSSVPPPLVLETSEATKTSAAAAAAAVDAARAAYLSEIKQLVAAGADVCYRGEGDVWLDQEESGDAGSGPAGAVSFGASSSCMAVPGASYTGSTIILAGGQSSSSSSITLLNFARRGDAEAVCVCLAVSRRAMDFTLTDNEHRETLQHLACHYAVRDVDTVMMLRAMVDRCCCSDADAEAQVDTGERDDSHSRNGVAVTRSDGLGDTLDWGQVNFKGDDFLADAARYQKLCIVWSVVGCLGDYCDRASPVALRLVWEWDWEAIGEDEQAFFTLAHASSSSSSSSSSLVVVRADRATARICKLAWKPPPVNVALLAESVAAGADVLFQDPVMKMPVLHQLVWKGEADAVACCLTTCRPLDWFAKDREGWSVFHCVCYAKDHSRELTARLLTLLLDRLTEKHQHHLPPSPPTGKTARGGASRGSPRGAVGARVDWRSLVDQQGRDVLAAAAAGGKLSVVWPLLRAYGFGVPHFTSTMTSTTTTTTTTTDASSTTPSCVIAVHGKVSAADWAQMALADRQALRLVDGLEGSSPSGVVGNRGSNAADDSAAPHMLLPKKAFRPDARHRS